MPPTAHAEIDRLLGGMVEVGELPGAAYAVAASGGPAFAGTVGRLAVAPAVEAMPPDPVYDLASLTKPLATAAIALRVAAAGRLDLDRPLRDHLPGWGTDDRAGLTPRDLLLHRSGLPAWEPLYRHCPDPAMVLDYLGRRPLDAPPRTRTVYSCLGYIALGRALEAAAGARLDDLFAREVAGPLGLRSTRYLPPAAWRRRVAPTEEGNRRERELAGVAAGEDGGWPEGILRAEVHDRNARHLGGVAGNAGLFGTAAEVERLLRIFLEPGLLDEAARAAARTPDGPPGPEVRTVGFQSAATPDSAAGAALSPSSFGHTGFTGTSAWADPETGCSFVLLTNRVHPRWRPEPMHPLRRAFHETAVRALGERGL